MANRARARTVPPLAMTLVPAPGCPLEHGPDGLGPVQGDLGDRLPVVRGEQLAGSQLATEAGRPEGHTGHGDDLVDGADARLEAPSAQIEAEHRVATHPDAGPLAEEAEPGLLLAAQQGDLVAQHLLEPADQPGPVVGVAEGGCGQRHHHVHAGVVARGGEPSHGADRRGGPVGRHAPGSGHLGPEVQERPAAQHRHQHPLPRRVDHHQVEGAAAQVEDGHAHGRHRRDAICCRPTGGTPAQNGTSVDVTPPGRWRPALG